jgi:response regulator RpfG family c-di-GMP phosphodiesterase
MSPYIFSESDCEVDKRIGEIGKSYRQEHKKIRSVVKELFGLIKDVSYPKEQLFDKAEEKNSRSLLADHCARTAFYHHCATDGKKPHVTAALFIHDIGKLFWPDYMHNENHIFSIDDLQIKRDHTTIAEYIATHQLKLPVYVCAILGQHHEKHNGKFGYPKGLSGDELNEHSMGAAVVDSLDAMTSGRGYMGNPRTLRVALAKLHTEADTSFGPVESHARNILQALIDLDAKDQLAIPNSVQLDNFTDRFFSPHATKKQDFLPDNILEFGGKLEMVYA